MERGGGCVSFIHRRVTCGACGCGCGCCRRRAEEKRRRRRRRGGAGGGCPWCWWEDWCSPAPQQPLLRMLHDRYTQTPPSWASRAEAQRAAAIYTHTQTHTHRHTQTDTHWCTKNNKRRKKQQTRIKKLEICRDVTFFISFPLSTLREKERVWGWRSARASGAHGSVNRWIRAGGCALLQEPNRWHGGKVSGTAWPRLPSTTFALFMFFTRAPCEGWGRGGGGDARSRPYVLASSSQSPHPPPRLSWWSLFFPVLFSLCCCWGFDSATFTLLLFRAARCDAQPQVVRVGSGGSAESRCARAGCSGARGSSVCWWAARRPDLLCDAL